MVEITFIEFDGSRRKCEGQPKMSVMEVAVQNQVEGIDADCGGACACATCHVYVAEPWMEVVGDRNQMENDMLEFAVDVRGNSRLACQVRVSEELHGLVVTVPEKQF
ncbi:2Fe-2S ferredoxin [Mesorhizobium sp. Root552]|jgi:2Fe-2S ferredoxin|uniref:2Fe-2S iron-sulfur cluster-binding protein n=1 Tax=Mesorhizobium sp. Root552 TaxID=1736555 RepID=UPI0006F70508|nr:2Fe-2S iron-sulfur cluster-binding protein [Mesorhizobium sp. Root552]KQZ26597.1 2Fe-2S ferredoxin [Mesorhizobium sp. Root552]